MSDTNRLFDHPTYRICRLTLLELRDVLEYGELAVEAIVSDETRASLRDWTSLLQELLSAAGDLDGGEPTQARHAMMGEVGFVSMGIVPRDRGRAPSMSFVNGLAQGRQPLHPSRRL